MVIAKIKPDEITELEFDLAISGTKDDPSDIRFVIEANDNGVRDSFSIICRAFRTDNGVKVVIPRLINLLQRGSHKARLEVILENRIFTPLQETIEIEEPVDVVVPNKPTVAQVTEETEDTPQVRVVFRSDLTNVSEGKDEKKKKDKKEDDNEEKDSKKKENDDDKATPTKKDKDDDDGELRDRSDNKSDKDKDNVSDKKDKDDDRDEEGEIKVYETKKKKKSILDEKPVFRWSRKPL